MDGPKYQSVSEQDPEVSVTQLEVYDNDSKHKTMLAKEWFQIRQSPELKLQLVEYEIADNLINLQHFCKEEGNNTVKSRCANLVGSSSKRPSAVF